MNLFRLKPKEDVVKWQAFLDDVAPLGSDVEFLGVIHRIMRHGVHDGSHFFEGAVETRYYDKNGALRSAIIYPRDVEPFLGVMFDDWKAGKS